MTIEAILIEINNNLKRIANSLEYQPKEDRKPAPAPVIEVPAPVIEVPAPVIEAPAPAPVADCPINTPKEFVTYIMDSYAKLGQRGQAIQGILTSLGVSNINQVPADKYGYFYTEVERLKASA